MKKHILVIVTFFVALAASAQSRGIRIGYIDMDYILSKVPDYAQANSQLEQKAIQWKKEMEVKRNDITKLKDNLKAERVLLTKELIEEREEEITFQENELLAYQEKRFGPKGDLITQKSVLVKPIQDQVFTAVQEIAEKKYDFVFDKSSDLTMLFSNQRYDISDQVVRRITRASNREQRSNKELKQIEKKEAEEDLMDDPDYAERQKSKEEKKNARQEALDKRNADRAAKREAALQRREQLKQERLDKRNGVTSSGTEGTTTASGSTATGATQTNNAPAQNTNLNDDDIDDDAPATTNRTTPSNGNRTSPNNTSLPVNNTTDRRTQGEPIQGQNTLPVKTTATDTPEEGTQQSVNRQQAAQEAQDARAKKLEERKRAQEERKQKILAEREAAKKAREEQKNNKDTDKGNDKDKEDNEPENKN